MLETTLSLSTLHLARATARLLRDLFMFLTVGLGAKSFVIDFFPFSDAIGTFVSLTLSPSAFAGLGNSKIGMDSTHGFAQLCSLKLLTGEASISHLVFVSLQFRSSLPGEESLWMVVETEENYGGENSHLCPCLESLHVLLNDFQRGLPVDPFP